MRMEISKEIRAGSFDACLVSLTMVEARKKSVAKTDLKRFNLKRGYD